MCFISKLQLKSKTYKHGYVSKCERSFKLYNLPYILIGKYKNKVLYLQRLQV